MADLTTEKLTKVLLMKYTKLKNKCLFYTGVENNDRSENGLGLRENLSQRAVDFACANGLITIWVRVCAELSIHL